LYAIISTEDFFDKSLCVLSIEDIFRGIFYFAGEGTFDIVLKLVLLPCICLGVIRESQIKTDF